MSAQHSPGQIFLLIILLRGPKIWKCSNIWFQIIYFQNCTCHTSHHTVYSREHHFSRPQKYHWKSHLEKFIPGSIQSLAVQPILWCQKKRFQPLTTRWSWCTWKGCYGEGWCISFEENAISILTVKSICWCDQTWGRATLILSLLLQADSTPFQYLCR